MMATVMKCVASALIFCFSVVAGNEPERVCPPEKTKPAFENLDFSIGQVGSAPVGWLLGPEWWLRPNAPVYSATILSGASCQGGLCVEVRPIREPDSQKTAFLYQLVDATPYRGKLISLRESVRTDGSDSIARLLIHIHGPTCSSIFRDDMGKNPVHKDTWDTYQMQAPVAIDALYLEVGTQLVGAGSIWIQNVSISGSPLNR